MNIIKRPTVDYYQKVFPEAETALADWYDQFKRTNFKTPQELKSVYGNASIVGFATHKQYDQIDVETVSFDNKLIEK